MRIKKVQMTDSMFPSIEGELILIYGHIGGGKTTYATDLLLKACARGIKVFASWPVNIQEYNELNSKTALFWSLFGLKSRFRTIAPGIFEYISLDRFMSETFLEELADMTDCIVAVDEAYAARLFDSYRKTNMSVKARMAIYATRHVNRKFIVVAQRPNSIHVSARAMMNRFYRCEFPLSFIQKFLHMRLFVITQFQDMVDETIDETKPASTRLFWASNALFKAFDSKYMRGGIGRKYPPPIQDYDVGYLYRWRLFFRSLLGRRVRLSAPAPSLLSDSNSLSP